MFVKLSCNCYMPQAFRYSKGATNYIDTDHKTLHSLYCLIADKPECEQKIGSPNLGSYSSIWTIDWVFDWFI